jgi:hypothetical protein
MKRIIKDFLKKAMKDILFCEIVLFFLKNLDIKVFISLMILSNIMIYVLCMRHLHSPIKTVLIMILTFIISFLGSVIIVFASNLDKNLEYFGEKTYNRLLIYRYDA